MAQDTDAGSWLESRPVEMIPVGESASLSRRVVAADLAGLASLGDAPGTLPRMLVADDGDAPAPASVAMGLIAALLDTRLPGPGATCLAGSFASPVAVAPGDRLTATVCVTARDEASATLHLACTCTNQHGDEVLSGSVTLRAPPRHRRFVLAAAAPEAGAGEGHPFYTAMMARAALIDPVPTAIVHPVSASALAAAAAAAQAGLIAPVLLGPEKRIRAAALEAGIDLEGLPIIACLHSHAAAERAVAMVREGAVAMLMKGSLHTDELLGAVVDRQSGLRTERRISHAFLMSLPGRETPLIITDAAINVAPDLCAKADIIRNAIDLARVVGIAEPKVAILAAVETVNPSMRATLDAASLCKMADRGQITGGLIDGPLAYDNAMSEAAAREKGIVSPVAGRADVLVAPDIEAGNVLAKQLSFTAHCDAAGVVLGARVPIILTSRADSLRSKLASCAVAAIMSRAATLAAPGLPA